MNDQDIWTAGAAFLLPAAIAVVNQRHWSGAAKGVCALILCGLAALCVLLLRGHVDWHDWRHVLALVIPVALLSYHTFWQPSGIAPRIEAATTLGSGGAHVQPTPPA